MVNRVMVYGANSFYGLHLCEELVSQGIETHAIFIEETRDDLKKLVDEHLLYIGRNALLEVEQYRSDLLDSEADVVIVCHEELRCEEEVEYLTQASEISKQKEVPLLYIHSVSERANQDKHRVNLKRCMNVLKEEELRYCQLKVPLLFGPFQDKTEKVNALLLEYLDQKTSHIEIDEPVVYVKDATRATYGLLDMLQEGMVYYLNGRKFDDKACTLPITSSERNNEVKQDEKIIDVPETSSLEECIKKQIDFLREQ
ncbi:hypothetical protein [Bacillus weihaiensis]|uniref:hypothetical protein n=1 Tax=Bacillus weihaiensis TaxID=1547283 RepID=UPI0023569746|nr:hypothetical protein [Bacillus weihaiensis]